jgi:hypothetical protein
MKETISGKVFNFCMRKEVVNQAVNLSERLKTCQSVERHDDFGIHDVAHQLFPSLLQKL